MKTLVLTMALAIALAWPTAGEAQSQQPTARGKATTKQYVQRPAKVAKRSAAPSQRSATPCARQMWWGCTGWDPDPAVRDMLARDVGDDN